jgi:hypothetical protein
MTPETATPAHLLISPRGNRQGPLYPEQTADFDIALRNGGPAPLAVKALEGNLDTPAIRLFGPDGIIGIFDKRARAERMIGNASTIMQGAPKMVTLPPGGQNATWVNLWGFHDALPPGTYSFDVVHEVNESGGEVVSDRQKFDIVPVRVRNAAFGYDSRSRAQSELAWLAAPEGAAKVRLLLRESGFAGHGSLHQGGTVLGEFEPDTRLSLGQLAWDAVATPVGWVAAFSRDGHADLFRYASAFPQGPSIRADLGIRDPIPVPRFPNRGHAVALATGESAKGPALAGAVVAPGSPAHSWTVPLQALPKLSACAFMNTGTIQILLVSDDGHQSTVRILEVDENGKVITPEQTVRTTPNEIVAVTVGQRSPQAFFVLLEADRVRHDRMALLRIAATGERKLAVTDLGRVSGWPSAQAADGPVPQPAQALQLEQAMDGAVWLALTDARGDLYGGKVDGALALIREAKGSPLFFPQVAALKVGITCFGFTANGQMFLPPGSRSH